MTTSDTAGDATGALIDDRRGGERGAVDGA